MIVGIHQPNFFPWLGYFVKIAKSDKFIFLDDVQFPKTGGSYVNRSEIVIQEKRSWLTVDIKREHGTWKINESKFAKHNFRKKLWGTIQANYGKSPYFKENMDSMKELVFFQANNLASYNMNAISQICAILKIDTKLFYSSEIGNDYSSTEHLIDLVKTLNGDTYLSGSGGDNYQEKKLFQEANIELIYNKFQYPVYKHHQCDSFFKGLSIIDLIYNIDIHELRQIIKNNE